jgi:hypothetical protein
MSTPAEALTKWFDDLSPSEQQEVVRFLYGGKMLMEKGLYAGPYPGTVNRGLHCGPVPSSSANVCPTCGKPY